MDRVGHIHSMPMDWRGKTMSHTSATRRLGSILAAPFYLAFLALSALFVGLYTLICAAVAGRPRNDGDGDATVARASWPQVAVDGVTVALAYLVADVLRVTLRENTGWPERLEGYGSTLTTHLVVLGVITLAWMIILQRLGWYQHAMHSLRARLRTILTATVLLTLTLATTALLFAREVYPRAQIGFFLVVLPVMSAVMRGLVDWWQQGQRGGRSRLEPKRAW